MQEFFGLPPDRRTKRMPQSLQAPLPLAVHPSRIALHCIASPCLQCSSLICSPQLWNHTNFLSYAAYFFLLPIPCIIVLCLGQKPPRTNQSMTIGWPAEPSVFRLPSPMSRVMILPPYPSTVESRRSSGLVPVVFPRKGRSLFSCTNSRFFGICSRTGALC